MARIKIRPRWRLRPQHGVPSMMGAKPCLEYGGPHDSWEAVLRFKVTGPWNKGPKSPVVMLMQNLHRVSYLIDSKGTVCWIHKFRISELFSLDATGDTQDDLHFFDSGPFGMTCNNLCVIVSYTFGKLKLVMPYVIDPVTGDEVAFLQGDVDNSHASGNPVFIKRRVKTTVEKPGGTPTMSGENGTASPKIHFRPMAGSPTLRYRYRAAVDHCSNGAALISRPTRPAKSPAAIVNQGGLPGPLPPRVIERFIPWRGQWSEDSSRGRTYGTFAMLDTGRGSGGYAMAMPGVGGMGGHATAPQPWDVLGGVFGAPTSPPHDPVGSAELDHGAQLYGVPDTDGDPMGWHDEELWT